MHGHIPFFGMAFGGFHLILAIVFLYLFYNISKSLQRIADGMEKKEIKLQLLRPMNRNRHRIKVKP